MKTRAALVAMAHRLEELDGFAHVDRLFEICHEVAPSKLGMCLMSWCVLAYKSRNITVVESGGALFTSFLDQMASPVSHELWARHRSSVRRHGDSVLDSTEFAAIRQREHGKFYGWLVFATSNVKPQSRKHMFLQTFSAKYHGLSRLGQKILGHFGLLMKHTQYDSMETKEVIAQRKEIR